MEWNHYSIGGEICRDPSTNESYARFFIDDRMNGRWRDGPISAAQLEELIEDLTKLKDALPANHKA